MTLSLPDVPLIVQTGTWSDGGASNGRHDAGEVFNYTIAVENEGTVTLSSPSLIGTNDSVSCATPGPELLQQGEGYECTAFRQV